ncbi:MAG: efflux RND transporter periplasmic adaptor subunit [Patescibacteria group bacterium]|nr:efflux RND transporter periplasmic adaptor subunit [Patescibacteria group bacterium]
MLRNFFKMISRHKIITTIVILALAGGGYFGYKALKGNTTETRYVLATVEKGTLVTSVTGTGQVLPVNQIDIKPRVAGDIIDINLKSGQAVSSGEVIAKLDVRDATKAVSDAKINLNSAKLALEKLTSSSLSTKQDYVDAYNTLEGAFLNLTTSINGIDDILHYSSYIWGDNGKAVEAFGGTATTYRKDAEQKYAAARQKYDKNLKDYSALNRDSAISTLESVLEETYNTIELSTEAIKSTKVLVDYVNNETDPNNRTTAMTVDQTSLATYTTKADSDLTDLLAAQQAIKDSQQAIKDSQIDVQSQQLAIQLKESALGSVQKDLPKYTVVAPFDGVITTVNSKKGDSITTATAIATLISKEMIAEVTLNEVDMAKVQLGQKATLTFDAIEGLSLTGEVAEIDTLGTVTQGVVTYNATIAFDTQDKRIKPNMSVSATIITEAKQNVLLVPNSAVKSSGNNTNYVEMLEPTVIASQPAAGSAGIVSRTPPRDQQIQVGLVNDTSTEVISGLKEGDQVIIQTINTSSTQSTQSQSQGGLFQVPGGANRGGGAGIRGASQIHDD